MDNICIKKIWQEENLFEVQFIFSAKNIKCSSNVYVSSEELQDLDVKLLLFLENRQPFFWQCGERGHGTFPSVSFDGFCEDKLGHVKIEVFAELDDGGNLDKHNLCFYINTEIGLLYLLEKQIVLFEKAPIGKRISLIDEEQLEDGWREHRGRLA